MAVRRRSEADQARTCLLVDDNVPLLDALASLLEGEGMHVAGRARTGLEALELVRRLATTAIVLDARLPDIDGLEVARRAAEIARKRTPVVFYTSYADPAFVAEALDVGARGVVLKDAAPGNLLEALATVAAGDLYVDPRLRLGRTESRG